MPNDNRFASTAEYMAAFGEPGEPVAAELAFVPIAFAADYLKVTPSTINQMAKRGALKLTKIDGPTKTWVGVVNTTLIAYRRNAMTYIPNLAKRAKAVLEDLARKRKTIRLMEVMPLIGLDPRVPQLRNTLHRALSKVCGETYLERGVLLSALCAYTVTGKPTERFFQIAEELGAMKHGVSPEAFLKSHIRKIYKQYPRMP